MSSLVYSLLLCTFGSSSSVFTSYVLHFSISFDLVWAVRSWASDDTWHFLRFILSFRVLLSDPKTARADSSATLCMFVTRMVLGNVFICRKPTAFRKPPCTGKDCHKDNCVNQSHQPFFHSVVGTHKNDNTRLIFREFVVYDLSQAYPEFLVEYERQ